MQLMEIPDADHSLSDIIMVSFIGNETPAMGQISQMVSTNHYNLLTNFNIKNPTSPHNVIMGCPWLHKLDACLSKNHQVLWYPTPYGPPEIKDNFDESQKIDIISIAWLHQRWTLIGEESTTLLKIRPNEDAD